jgi:hypothetical protein
MLRPPLVNRLSETSGLLALLPLLQRAEDRVGWVAVTSWRETDKLNHLHSSQVLDSFLARQSFPGADRPLAQGGGSVGAGEQGGKGVQV